MGELTQVLGRIDRDGEHGGGASSTGTTRRRPTTCGRPAPTPSAWRAGSPPSSGDLRPGGRFTIHFDDADTPRVES